jgi:hypothetical protein
MFTSLSYGGMGIIMRKCEEPFILPTHGKSLSHSLMCITAQEIQVVFLLLGLKTLVGFCPKINPTKEDCKPRMRDGSL